MACWHTKSLGALQLGGVTISARWLVVVGCVEQKIELSGVPLERPMSSSGREQADDDYDDKPAWAWGSSLQLLHLLSSSHVIIGGERIAMYWTQFQTPCYYREIFEKRKWPNSALPDPGTTRPTRQYSFLICIGKKSTQSKNSSESFNSDSDLSSQKAPSIETTHIDIYQSQKTIVFTFASVLQSVISRFIL
uniref:SFRICE_029420 n=1 Tax=Spodoptera frugiperda TaxID=7108 RepID=A0A2H1WTG5_SPOFR